MLGIIVILKNKTVQTLSWRNGMMGLFSTHTVSLYLSPTLLLTCGTMSACSLGGAAFLPVVLGILSESMRSQMLKIQTGFNTLCHSFWKASDWERSWKFFQYHNDPKTKTADKTLTVMDHRVQTWISLRQYGITWTEKEMKDSLSLKKNSGKYWRKSSIIYHKITKENFDNLPKRVQDAQRAVTLNTDFCL